MRRIQALFSTPTREACTLFCLGALGGLAFSPWHVWILFIVSCSLLCIHLDGETTPLDVVRVIWLWALGQFCVAFHWVSFSLCVDWGKFFWLLPFSLLGIPAGLALFPAFFCGIGWLFFPPGPSRWLFWAAAWGLAEWVRGHFVFGGFGWNLASGVWAASLPFLQSLSFWGPYGLSVVTILLATMPYLIFSGQLRPLQRGLLIGSVCCLSLGLLFGGFLRIKPTPLVPGCWMRLVQPNVSQVNKWNGTEKQKRVQDLFTLSQRPSVRPITHILWPESPLPFALNGISDLRGYQLPLKPTQHLLTGMLRLTKGPLGTEYVWNSLMVFDAQGRTEGCYDKAHLVPFGEYIPLRNFLSRFFSMDWLKKITAGDRDFVAGSDPQTLSIPGAPPVSPLICFDVAFAGEVVNPESRPGWLLDITNDAWFQDSWGLFQHFEQGLFRAIEEGLPLVRVANTGISGVIDPYGRILAQLPIETQGIWDFGLPRALPPTFYSRWREGVFWLLIISLGLGAWAVAKPPRLGISRFFSSRRKPSKARKKLHARAARKDSHRTSRPHKTHHRTHHRRHHP